MADEGYEVAEFIPFYLLECLLWNVPEGLRHGNRIPPKIPMIRSRTESTNDYAFSLTLPSAAHH